MAGAWGQGPRTAGQPVRFARHAPACRSAEKSRTARQACQSLGPRAFRKGRLGSQEDCPEDVIPEPLTDGAEGVLVKSAAHPSRKLRQIVANPVPCGCAEGGSSHDDGGTPERPLWTAHVQGVLEHFQRQGEKEVVDPRKPQKRSCGRRAFGASCKYPPAGVQDLPYMEEAMRFATA